MSSNSSSFGPDPARGAGSVQEHPLRNGSVRNGADPIVRDGTDPGRAYLDPFQTWENRSRIVLTPIAAPSILGLFGFFAATLIVGSNIAGWWGSTASLPAVATYALVLGGLAQFLAGMWAYRARDAVATAMHGTWGAFWIAWGLTQLLTAGGALVPMSHPKDVAFGFWFITLALITGSGAFAALADNLGLFLLLGALATGSGFMAAGEVGGISWCEHLAGWLFVAAAGVAWYVATAMMLESKGGRVVLPLGKYKSGANVPGRQIVLPIAYESGMPGSRVGQ